MVPALCAGSRTLGTERGLAVPNGGLLAPVSGYGVPNHGHQVEQHCLYLDVHLPYRPPQNQPNRRPTLSVYWGHQSPTHQQRFPTLCPLSPPLSPYPEVFLVHQPSLPFYKVH